MGWKNIRDHYRIAHIVQVEAGKICIGSPYIHDIIVISESGELIKYKDYPINKDLTRYQTEMLADPETLKRLATEADTFTADLHTVWTYDGADIIEKLCEVPGWPNVTTDGDLMYENTFFSAKHEAVAKAKRNSAAGIKNYAQMIADKSADLDRIIDLYRKEQDDLATLIAEYPESTPAENGSE